MVRSNNRQSIAMKDAKLIDVLERAESWPVEDRAKLVAAARLIEAQRESGFDLSAEDWRIIDERVASANRGEIASEEETADFFRKYRSA
jgi:hypothetical protein